MIKSHKIEEDVMLCYLYRISDCPVKTTTCRASNWDPISTQRFRDWGLIGKLCVCLDTLEIVLWQASLTLPLSWLKTKEKM